MNCDPPSDLIFLVTPKILTHQISAPIKAFDVVFYFISTLLRLITTASPYAQNIESYFSSIIMANKKFSSGSWIFRITMLLSNMSRELNILANVFSRLVSKAPVTSLNCHSAVHRWPASPHKGKPRV